MSKEQLLAEILRLPVNERRGLVEQAIDSFEGDSISDPDMTPDLRAELDRRHADMLAHPEDEVSWDEVSKKMRSRKCR
jgi:putative addiction module component (TIGR02574 family)